MATLAQRTTAVAAIMQGGQGLVARVRDDTTDEIEVHDPFPDNVPTGGAKTPVAGQASFEMWRRWPGTDAQTAYGL